MPDTIIHIPPGSISLADIEVPQIRLFLQGDGGTGKTWSGLTFPNPIILSTDRGAGAHRGRVDVHEAPFFNPAFVRTICADSEGVVNVKNAVLKWLKTEGMKLTGKQTLAIDNLTGLDRHFHLYEAAHPTYSTRSGKIDEFAVWQHKVEYFSEIMSVIKSLACHVVFIGHETNERGKDGELNGKLKPLINGQFADQIRSHFTDYVRQLTCNKPDLTKMTDASWSKINSLWGMSSTDFSLMCDEYPRNTLYYWQLESDDMCNCKISSLVNFPRYIPANYESFIKYLRK